MVLVEVCCSFIDCIDDDQPTPRHLNGCDCTAQRIDEKLPTESTSLKIAVEGKFGQQNGRDRRGAAPSQLSRQALSANLMRAQADVRNYDVAVAPDVGPCDVRSVRIKGRSCQPLIQNLVAAVEIVGLMVRRKSLGEPHCG